ncbi:MAG: hypothetical protein ABIL68_12200 [bacterium]
MTLNRITFYAKLLLVLTALFLAGFVLFYLKGPEGYSREILEIIKLYFLGWPTLLFALFLVCVNTLMLITKRPARLFLFWNVVLFIIYLMSFNMASFPLLSRVSEYDEGPLLVRKHDSSIHEAVQNTIDSYKYKMNDYLKLHQVLSNKCLIVPKSDPLADDLYFYFFIHPRKIEKKDYQFLLSEEDYQKLRKFNTDIIRAFRLSGKNYAYYLLSGLEESKDVFVFAHDRFYLFVSRELADDLLK